MANHFQKAPCSLRLAAVIAGLLVTASLSATPARAQPGATLGEADARSLIGPLYAALNAPSAGTMEAILEAGTATAW